MTPKQKAVINFVYFAANFPAGFIHEVWKDNPNLAQHLSEKLEALTAREGRNYVTLNVFFQWFLELSNNNEALLIDWVESRYHWSHAHTDREQAPPPVFTVETLFNFDLEENDQKAILVDSLTEDQKNYLGII